jgi:hypothetical protein
MFCFRILELGLPHEGRKHNLRVFEKMLIEEEGGKRRLKELNIGELLDIYFSPNLNCNE